MTDTTAMNTTEDGSDNKMAEDDQHHMVIPDLNAVVLIGKLGAGKSTLGNKLTGARWMVSGSEQSATLTAAIHKSIDDSMYVIDTPGYDPHKHVLEHIAEVIGALESVALSQVVLVEEIGRIGSLVVKFRTLLGLLGCDMASLIVTKTETMLPDYNVENARSELASALSVDINRILFVQSTTPAQTILTFLQAGMHRPRRITLSQDQVAGLLAPCSVQEQFEREITIVTNKLAAISEFVSERCVDNILLLHLSNFALTVRDECQQQLFADVAQENPHAAAFFGMIRVRLNLAVNETQKMIHAKLSYAQFLKSPSTYRKCGFCGLIWTKVEGCDGPTRCGARPSMSYDRLQNYDVHFTLVPSKCNNSTWHLEWSSTPIRYVRSVNFEAKGAGCDRMISWRSMEPVSESALEELVNAKEIPQPPTKFDSMVEKACNTLNRRSTHVRRSLRLSVLGSKKTTSA